MKKLLLILLFSFSTHIYAGSIYGLEDELLILESIRRQMSTHLQQSEDKIKQLEDEIKQLKALRMELDSFSGTFKGKLNRAIEEYQQTKRELKQCRMK